MTPEINFAIAAERRADTQRAAARTAGLHDHRTERRALRRRLSLERLRLRPGWLRFTPAAQPLACCA